MCYSLIDMTLLREKIVLVTGGHGGLGQALARGFVKQGCRVVITARNEERLTTAAAQIRQDGGQVLALPCDITDRQQVEALNNKINAEWGPVQVLINNAGLAKAAAFLEMADSLWDEIIKTNLTGAYIGSKVFLPGMIKLGWGRVINMGSTSSKVGYSHVTAYTASKHGLLGLTRSLALETARLGITVNAICPGYIDNELTRANARQMAEKTGKSVAQVLDLYAATSPQKRLIAPEEVASLAVFLAADIAGAITGQAINIDGGAVMA
jgi:NAD(P)-dependent dehydrogenase (short-subunit alcohol dehydrogenase family)